ncbi:RNA polymerase sigma-70 factor [Pedobacter sp. AW31-3R]|uniref:RNA polymerase sigma-70 factor n=1 Tax=Pedobacter sp. AW31-3R TaxID=3445781 RepID=UPI003F9EC3B2
MIAETKQQDLPADFDEIYLMYYPALNRYASSMVRDDAIAEDMVHNVFLKLVENGEALNNSTYQKAYLYRAVYNECMNHLKHQQIESTYQKHSQPRTEENQEKAEKSVQYKELQQAINNALNHLPEQCRMVFQLSRYEQLKYREIAGMLEISVNTVEKHMVKALKRLRIQLEDYLPLLIFWLLIN